MVSDFGQGFLLVTFLMFLRISITWHPYNFHFDILFRIILNVGFIQDNYVIVLNNSVTLLF